MDMEGNDFYPEMVLLEADSLAEEVVIEVVLVGGWRLVLLLCLLV